MIAIIEGCGSNIASIQFALQRLGVDSILTTDPSQIKSADKVILPGVGHAHTAMQRLHDLQLVEIIRNLTQPVLGICLGMQILYEASEEGHVDCLGLIPDTVKKLPSMPHITIPHMGWNTLQLKDSKIFMLQNIQPDDYVYFVHSYAAPVNDYTIATTEHGIPFTAMVAKDNFYGAQFHPERSGMVGEKILNNFLNCSVL